MTNEAIPVSRQTLDYIKSWISRARDAGMKLDEYGLEDICHTLEKEHRGKEEWRSVWLEMHEIQQKHGRGDLRGPFYIKE